MIESKPSACLLTAIYAASSWEDLQTNFGGLISLRVSDTGSNKYICEKLMYFG